MSPREAKLGRCLDTLPERLALARAQSLPHVDFLSLLLSDEVERPDRSSPCCGLGPRSSMRACASTPSAATVFDRELWNELCSLRFVDDARGALILGPVVIDGS